MGDTAIKVEGLGKRYVIGHQKEADLRNAFGARLKRVFGNTTSEKEDFWALKDVSFEIKKGEAVGIIGRNGAGKSTLLKILSRITEPSTGRFEINGRVSSLLEVGTGFHMELSGRENIYLNGTILGMKRAEIRQKFDEIVAFSGVEKFIDTPVKHYSSGMKVRLAFSVAAHLEPEILIVDEVLAVGDAEFQKKCLGKMDEVSKNEGRTVIFVSHNMGAVQNLCGKGITMSQGAVEYEGSIENAIGRYILASKETISKKLEERADRSGNRALLFTSIRFKDYKSNNFIETLVSGGSVRIEFNYKTTLDIGSDVTISIGFFTAQGMFLFACRSDTIGAIIKINEEGKTTCLLSKLPLRKGTYYFNLIAYRRGEVLDHIVEAGEVYVEAGDFYNTGKIPAGDRSGVLVDYAWS